LQLRPITVHLAGLLLQQSPQMNRRFSDGSLLFFLNFLDVCMDSSRLVSIVIPALRADFLEQTLASALAQSHAACEIVICDDSTDGAIENIVETLRPSATHPIRYLRNVVPAGETASLSRAIEQAQGLYIKVLQDGAVLAPECVERMLGALQRHDSASLVTSRRQWIDAQGQPVDTLTVENPLFVEDAMLDSSDTLAFLAGHACNFIGELGSVLFRRSAFLALGNAAFSLKGQSLPAISELLLFANLLRKGHLIMLSEPMVTSRLVPPHADAPLPIVPGRHTEEHIQFQRLMREAGLSAPLLINHLAKGVALSAPQIVRHYNLLVSSWQPELILSAEQVENWQNGRQPNATQLPLIEDYLAAPQNHQSLLIVVFDDSGSDQALDHTLQSLEGLSPQLPALEVVVVSPRHALPGTSFSGSLTLHPHNGADRASLMNQVIDRFTFDWVMFTEAGTRFTAFGLAAVAIRLATSLHCRALFADEMYRDQLGQMSSAMRPDLNLDYLLSLPLIMAGHWFFRRDELLQLDGFDPAYAGAAEFDVILRLIERDGLKDIEHVSEPLLVRDIPVPDDNPDEMRALQRHLQVRGYPDAQVLHSVPRRYHVQYGHKARPLVSIIVPTKDQLPMLRRCVDSLLEKTLYTDYELLIVDNNSETPEALEWFAGIDALNDDKVRILRYPLPFNYSAINNMAARQARGEYLVLLNNDTAVVHGNWLDELLNHALRPEVGTVGAKLLFTSGRLQHAGVLLGYSGPATHIFVGDSMYTAGYMQRVQVDNNYSAVTAACMMIRRSIYEEVGGLNEQDFTVSYNDVDLCMNVGALGYLHVWTPHSVLIHEGSISQVYMDTDKGREKRRRFEAEQAAMYRKWLPVLANDPAINRNMATHVTSIELESLSQTWQPMPWRPLPVTLVHPGGSEEIASYGLIAPFLKLRDAGLIDGSISTRTLSVIDMERYKPDVLVFQCRLDQALLDAMEQARRYCGALIILELGELPIELAAVGHDPDNRYEAAFELLHAIVRQVDRVVVPSQALAQIARGLHNDVRVIEHRLDSNNFPVIAARTANARPRIGLLGRSCQLEDLQELLPTLQALADEVDWIMIGNYPPALRELLCEVHDDNESHSLPGLLASLNLDLGLAPAVQNLYSDCKSNLALLHFGAAGIPVVCSEARCHDGDLPVTRVRNGSDEWLSAISAHINDPQGAVNLGQQLRRQVLRDWTWQQAHLLAWGEAWLVR
jgi:GT2 family glycosyltransferase